MSDRCAAGRPWHREPLVWLLVLFPALSVLMGAVMIVLAVRSDDGLVADDYYRRGLEINRVLARDETAARRALEAVVTRVPEGGVEVRVAGRDGPLEAPAGLALELRHATRAGRDARVALTRTGPGRYRGTAAWPSQGAWQVELGTSDWRLTGRLDTGATSVRLRPQS